MKAVVYHGAKNISVDEVPDPKIQHPTDAIIKVTSTAICGSDLHLYGGYIPDVNEGDILGHEFMGEVVEVGRDVIQTQIGQRVLSPFVIACGHCYFCKRDETAFCEESNPNAEETEKLMGHAPAGLFGYSGLFGGYDGGQAQYVRVPFADTGLFSVPDKVKDEQALLLTDVLPTGYMAAEECNITSRDTVAIWGAGPVGQFTALSAKFLGAKKVIVIDFIPERLKLAEQQGADVINSENVDVVSELKKVNEGRGPDVCIDAVGMEAHASGLEGLYDKVKQTLKLENDRAAAIRQIVIACKKGGIISIPGVYSGFVDKFPLGQLFNKGLKLRSGQTHVHRYVKPLLNLVQEDILDPSFIISHRVSIDDAPEMYETFREKEDNCIKVVLDPWS